MPLLPTGMISKMAANAVSPNQGGEPITINGQKIKPGDPNYDKIVKGMSDKEVTESSAEGAAGSAAGETITLGGQKIKSTDPNYAKIVASLGSALFTPETDVITESENTSANTPSKVTSTKDQSKAILLKLSSIDNKLTRITGILTNIGKTLNESLTLQKERFDNYELDKAKRADDSKRTGGGSTRSTSRSSDGSSLLEGIPWAMLLLPLGAALMAYLSDKITKFDFWVLRLFSKESMLFKGMEGITRTLTRVFDSALDKFTGALRLIEIGYKKTYNGIAALLERITGNGLARQVVPGSKSVINAPNTAGLNSKETKALMNAAGYEAVVNPTVKAAQAAGVTAGRSALIAGNKRAGSVSKVLEGTYYVNKKTGEVATEAELQKVVNTYGSKLTSSELQKVVKEGNVFTGEASEQLLKMGQVATSSPSRYKQATNVTKAFANLSKSNFVNLIKDLSPKDQAIVKRLRYIAKAFTLGSTAMELIRKAFEMAKNIPIIGKYVKYILIFGALCGALAAMYMARDPIAGLLSSGKALIEFAGMFLGMIIGDLAGGAAGTALGAAAAAPIAAILAASGIGLPAAVAVEVVGAGTGFVLGLLLSFYGAPDLGAYLGKKIGEYIFDGKTGEQIASDMLNDAKRNAVETIEKGGVGASIISSVLGAAAGALVAGPIGAVIGGVGGAVAGYTGTDSLGLSGNKGGVDRVPPSNNENISPNPASTNNTAKNTPSTNGKTTVLNVNAPQNTTPPQTNEFGTPTASSKTARADTQSVFYNTAYA
jgi:hypothetical protein